jgi:hypothetical protein
MDNASYKREIITTDDLAVEVKVIGHNSFGWDEHPIVITVDSYAYPNKKAHMSRGQALALMESLAEALFTVDTVRAAHGEAASQVNQAFEPPF